ncbi:MAG: hypothetical protein B6I26_07845 [Desulfobacteraceae bacterium 4572_130]|nr:MAG: hypothetical protein B6I26_07845 [Desulfobacteraceae bacterium 4572_130]
MRPKKNRCVKFNLSQVYFKPRSIPMFKLEEINLTVDEIEAVRLCDYLGMSHEQAGKSMNISRSTFGRIIQSARKKIAEALIYGKAIKIEGGVYKIKNGAVYFCQKCKHEWPEKKLNKCPKCKKEVL